LKERKISTDPTVVREFSDEKCRLCVWWNGMMLGFKRERELLFWVLVFSVQKKKTPFCLSLVVATVTGRLLSNMEGSDNTNIVGRRHVFPQEKDWLWILFFLFCKWERNPLSSPINFSPYGIYLSLHLNSNNFGHLK